MKKLNVVCLAASVAFSALAEDVSKVLEPDWAGICFAISNSCVREENSGNAWMAIAATKLKHNLSADQLLKAFRQCIEGLGDTPREDCRKHERTLRYERIAVCRAPGRERQEGWCRMHGV